MSSGSAWKAALVGTLCLGCTPFAVSPPARTMPLESPASLAEGRIAVQAAAGSTLTNTETAAVRARVGVVPGMEVQLEGSYVHHTYGDERGPHIGAARAGIKLAPAPHAAIVVGLGAGSHAHGAYLAPDVALIFGYENRDIVPWIALRAGVSSPIGPETIVVSHRSGFDDRVELFALVPPATGIAQAAIGMRLPIHIDRPPFETLNLHGGIGLTHLRQLSGDRDVTFIHGELGVELVLDTHIEDPDRLLFVEDDD